MRILIEGSSVCGKGSLAQILSKEFHLPISQESVPLKGIVVCSGSRNEWDIQIHTSALEQTKIAVVKPWVPQNIRSFLKSKNIQTSKL